MGPLSDAIFEYVIAPALGVLMVGMIFVLIGLGYAAWNRDPKTIELRRGAWDCAQSHPVMAGKVMVQECDSWVRLRD